MQPTFADRRNTNQEVFDGANRKAKDDGGEKEIITCRKFYKSMETKRLGRTIKHTNSDIQNITLRNHINLET